MSVGINKFFSLKIYSILAIAAFLFFFKCSDFRKPLGLYKSLYNNSQCAAVECHAETPLMSSIPTSGKHTVHLEKGNPCESCHYNYQININHKNGILDASTDAVIVYFDSLNPKAAWNNSSGDCSNLTCHGVGAASVNWYIGTTSCSICHASATGMPSDARHAKHVTGKGYACSTCHLNRGPGTSYHVNGTKDVNLSGGGTYVSPTCSGVSCHGGGSPDWTVAGPLDCKTCHTGSLTPGDTGITGKHASHVATRNIGCEVCHENYRADPKHDNGTFNTESITAFDTDASQGSMWGHVTTTFTEPGTCSEISCHGGGAADWYSPGTLGCQDCHNGGAIGPFSSGHGDHLSNNVSCTNSCCHGDTDLSHVDNNFSPGSGGWIGCTCHGNCTD